MLRHTHERLYWRYWPQWAVREGDWKLIGVKDHAKLFNVAEDAGEKKDLSAERPEVVKEMAEELRGIVGASRRGGGAGDGGGGGE